jgi:hypothetical protein
MACQTPTSDSFIHSARIINLKGEEICARNLRFPAIMLKNKLTIKEYAIIDKISKNDFLFKVQKESYTLLSQETYDSEIIKRHLKET